MELTQTYEYLVGIDEAGRGPLAGPLAVAAVAAPFPHKWMASNCWTSDVQHLKDSKRLSERQREWWYGEMCRVREQGELFFASAFVSPGVIDRDGVTMAARRGVAAALRKLPVPPEKSRVLLDGLLSAPRGFTNQETIIKGDEKEPLIALASIVAKVERDKKMCAVARRHPQYGFERHKGYGTKAHYAAIEQYGIRELHRKTFLKNYTI